MIALSILLTCIPFSDCIAIVSVIVAIITLFVTIHIAKVIPERDKLEHRKQIREAVSELAQQMKGGRNHMCKLIDIDRFEKLYPHNFNSMNRQSHFKAELDGTDIHGIVFVDKIVGVNKSERGHYIATRGENEYKAARCGSIPYEWIIDIDLNGDEIDTCPVLYCKFKKRKIALGHYCVEGKDGSLVNKFGFYQDRIPFSSYEYYLLDEKKDNPLRTYVTVKKDSDVL